MVLQVLPLAYNCFVLSEDIWEPLPHRKTAEKSICQLKSKLTGVGRKIQCQYIQRIISAYCVISVQILGHTRCLINVEWMRACTTLCLYNTCYIVVYCFAVDLSNRSVMGPCDVKKRKTLVRKDTNSTLVFNTFWLDELKFHYWKISPVILCYLLFPSRLWELRCKQNTH